MTAQILKIILVCIPTYACASGKVH